jgi:hypothetical protein
MLLATNALSVCCCFELLATAAGCWTLSERENTQDDKVTL